MVARKINFESVPHWDDLTKNALAFIKFFGAKCFRVCGIPEMYDTEELRQVLNTICKHKKDGIWYFVIDKESIEDIGMILILMDIELHVFVEPDEASWN